MATESNCCIKTLFLLWHHLLGFGRCRIWHHFHFSPLSSFQPQPQFLFFILAEICTAGDVRFWKHPRRCLVSFRYLESELIAARLSQSLFLWNNPHRIQLLCMMVISNLYRIGLGGQKGWLSQGCCHGYLRTRDNHWASSFRKSVVRCLEQFLWLHKWESCLSWPFA